MIGRLYNKMMKQVRAERDREMMRGWSEAWERAGNEVKAERDAMVRKDVFCECGRSATFWLGREVKPVFHCTGCGAVHRE